MTIYEVIEFDRQFTLQDDEAQVVAAELTERGARPTSRAHNRALVAFPEGSHLCGAPTADGGECENTVDEPQELCWRHTEDG